MPLVGARAVVVQDRQADGGEQGERDGAVVPPQENARRFQAGGAYAGERSVNQMNHLRASASVVRRARAYPDSLRLILSSAIPNRERRSVPSGLPRQRFSTLGGRARNMPYPMMHSRSPAHAR